MGMKQRQFLFGKTLTTTWPSATQIQHWNQVLRNLRARLVNREFSTGAQSDEESHFSQSKPWQDFSVSECVAALDEMHMALQRETAQRQKLERAFKHPKLRWCRLKPIWTACAVASAEHATWLCTTT